MKAIIIFMLLLLAGGYALQNHIISDPDKQWYCYFVFNDLKAWLVSLALCFATYKKPSFVYSLSALLLCSYDLLTQVLDVNIKGHHAELIYYLLTGLLIVVIIWNSRKK
jgi:hypothetical protein